MAIHGHGTSPCMVLNSYHNDVCYVLQDERGPPHSRLYTMSVTVMGEEFVGCGRSKKLAKQAAASKALQCLYKLQLSLNENPESERSAVVI